MKEKIVDIMFKAAGGISNMAEKETNSIIDAFIEFVELWDNEDYISKDEIKSELENMKS